MYSLVHVHLLLNHIPIILSALGLLFIVIGAVRHWDDMSRLAMAFFIGGALCAIPTYFTGDPAAHAVRRLPGVTREYIGQHEDAALIASVILGGVAIFSIWALWRYRRPAVLPRWVVWVTLVGGVFASSAMARTGLLGGEIRHTEVRPSGGVVDSSTVTDTGGGPPRSRGT